MGWNLIRVQWVLLATKAYRHKKAHNDVGLTVDETIRIFI
jgi:hypothetical protein